MIKPSMNEQSESLKSMANIKDRLPENAPGPFYVTDLCVDCGMCPELAPTVFKRHDDKGYSIVYHQPGTEAERQAAIEAMQGCPTEAIGNDGPA